MVRVLDLEVGSGHFFGQEKIGDSKNPEKLAFDIEECSHHVSISFSKYFFFVKKKDNFSGVFFLTWQGAIQDFVDFFKTTIFGVLHGILRLKPPCLSAFSSTKTDPGLSSTRRQKNVPQSGVVFVKDVISCGGFVQMTVFCRKTEKSFARKWKKPMCGHICTPTKTTDFTKFLHNTTLFERFPAMLVLRRKKLTLPESKIVLDKKASFKRKVSSSNHQFWLHKDTTTPPFPTFQPHFFIEPGRSTCHRHFLIQNWVVFPKIG